MKSVTSPILLAGLAVAALLCACQTGPSSATTTATAARRALDFKTLARASHCGLDAPQQRVIRTQAGWEQLWSALALGNTAARPEVDFGTSMVALVALGEMPGDSASVEIERVLGDAGFLLVEARARGGDSASSASCQPFHIVRLARDDAPVRFQIAR